MTEYRIFSKSVCDHEKCIYETYGIEAYESGEIIRKVGDISTDKTAVSELVRLFNKEELSILHLDIAIEDFLYELKV